MARYQDYVKDDLDSEIVDAQEKAGERQEAAPSGFEMPERFKGKSAEEIAKSYVDLERLNSKQAQDLGTMRKNVDELLALQSRPLEQPAEEISVDYDELVEQPKETIEKVATAAVNDRLGSIEQTLEKQSFEARALQFERDFPDWRQVAATEEFSNWVESSPYRTRLAKAADQFDFDAAEDLFGSYKEHLSLTEQVAAEADRRQKLADATMESSTTSHIESDEKFSRTDLQNARIAASKGDQRARQWLANHAEAIAIAYEEGHIVD